MFFSLEEDKLIWYLLKQSDTFCESNQPECGNNKMLSRVIVALSLITQSMEPPCTMLKRPVHSLAPLLYMVMVPENSHKLMEFGLDLNAVNSQDFYTMHAHRFIRGGRGLKI